MAARLRSELALLALDSVQGHRLALKGLAALSP
jgi:hypothetical protein